MHELIAGGYVFAAYTPVYGGIAEAVMKMALGNGIGFKYEDATSLDDIFGYAYGSFVLECDESVSVGEVIGHDYRRRQDITRK